MSKVSSYCTEITKHTHNATKCESSLQQDFSFSLFFLSRVLSNNSVTVTTVSKHQFHLVLQCGVNNTECTAHPQSSNRDGQTSNSTAAATFVRKSQDVSLSTPFSHLLLYPYLYLCRPLVLLVCFPPHQSPQSGSHLHPGRCMQTQAAALFGHIRHTLTSSMCSCE